MCDGSPTWQRMNTVVFVSLARLATVSIQVIMEVSKWLKQ
jgi:hypothetical protein